jgi:aminomethyltransferase
MNAPIAGNRDAQGKALLRTPLYRAETRLGASFVDFAGWQLPLRYRSELEEHQATRAHSGLFDISHMAKFRIRGPEAAQVLDEAVVSSIARLELGRARYSLACFENGGVLDDLIVYRVEEETYILVSNAVNRDAVLSLLRELARGTRASIEDLSLELALLALQGPEASAVLAPLASFDPAGLGRFSCSWGWVAGIFCLVATTGYTGLGGYELAVTAGQAEALWQALLGGEVPASPAGLASRDILRIEAGLPLYGKELTPERNPYQSGLGRLVELSAKGSFVGREALEKLAGEPPTPRLVGLMGEALSPAAHGGEAVLSSSGALVGEVTSGTRSPSLGRPIAFAYLEADFLSQAKEAIVEVRGRQVPYSIQGLPFVPRSH